MQRLIDKRRAIKHLKELLKNSIMPTEWYEGAKSAITLLQKEQTVDAEPTEEQVKEYCRKRCLVIVTNELFNEMKARVSATQKSVDNALEALKGVEEEPEINPCRGCGERREDEAD